MGSLNRVELIGNLGKQPEIKKVNSNNKVATFTLATTEPAYTLQNGTQVQEKTEWHNIVAWGSCASIAERFLKKGQQVYVEGKMKTRSYDNKNGQKCYITEVICEKIVLLSNSGGKAEQPQAEPQPVQQAAVNNYSNDDDLPF
jgi:single-strand DNA-binding protein